MSAIALAREQLGQVHAFIEGTLADVSDEQGQWHPPGVANPIGATVAHLAFGMDAFVALLSERDPLFTGAWQERTGVSEFPPISPPGQFPPLQPGWADWGRQVQVDMAALREYLRAVHSTADGYLTSLTDDDLDRSIDLVGTAFGAQPLSWLLSAGLLGHAWAHWGEICCLKGLQGGRGYLF